MNWWALILRVLAILILILIIILVGVGTLSRKFWLLAGLLSGGLVIVIILSYYKCKCCYNRDVQRFDIHGRVHSSNENLSKLYHQQNVSKQTAKSPMQKA